MNPALLDTDTVSEILKQKNQVVAKNALDYTRKVGPLAFSRMTRYEIMRGYKHLVAARQIAMFEVFCRNSVIIPTTDDVWELASDLWAQGRSQGLPHDDADLVIAATALVQGLTLVTGNTTHFSWIPGLILVDWRQP